MFLESGCAWVATERTGMAFDKQKVGEPNSKDHHGDVDDADFQSRACYTTDELISTMKFWMSTKRKGKNELKTVKSWRIIVVVAALLQKLKCYSRLMLGVGPERKLRRLVVFADYSNISCHFRSINKALRNNLGAVGFEVQQRLVLLTLFSLSPSVD